MLDVGIIFQCAVDQLVHLGHGLHAGEAGADHDEGEKLLLQLGVPRHIGHFQARDDMRAQAMRVAEVLHGERVLGQAWKTRQVDAHAERDDQLIIGKIDGNAPEALDHRHGLFVEVDAHDLGLAHLGMAEQKPQRHHRIGGMDGGGSDLGQERLEHEIIVVVDQLDVERLAAEPLELLGREHAAKAAADHQDLFLLHALAQSCCF